MTIKREDKIISENIFIGLLFYFNFDAKPMMGKLDSEAGQHGRNCITI